MNLGRVGPVISGKNCRESFLDAFFRHVMYLLSGQPTGEIVWAAGKAVHPTLESVPGQVLPFTNTAAMSEPECTAAIPGVFFSRERKFHRLGRDDQ